MAKKKKPKRARPQCGYFTDALGQTRRMDKWERETCTLLRCMRDRRLIVSMLLPPPDPHPMIARACIANPTTGVTAMMDLNVQQWFDTETAYRAWRATLAAYERLACPHRRYDE